MRNPARPSDPHAVHSPEPAEGAPFTGHLYSRANIQPLPPVTHPIVPQAARAPLPPLRPEAAPARPAHPAPMMAAPSGHALSGHNPARPASAASDKTVPSWLQPFSMPPNTRFTRTPDYLLRQPVPTRAGAAPLAASPASSSPDAPETAMETTSLPVPPRPSLTPVLRVPPRKPPLGDVPKALIAAHARRALAAQPSPGEEESETASEMVQAAPVSAPEATASFYGVPGLAPANDHTPLSSFHALADFIAMADEEPEDDKQEDDAPELIAAAHIDTIEFVAGDDLPDETEDSSRFDAVSASPADYEDAMWEPEGYDPFAREQEDFIPEAYAYEAAVIAAHTRENAAENASPAAAAGPVVEAPVEPVAVEPEPTSSTLTPASGIEGYSARAVDVSFSWPTFTILPEAPASVPAATVSIPAPAPQSPPALLAIAEPRPEPTRAIAPVRAMRDETDEYELPSLELLTEPPSNEPDYELSEEFLDRNSVKLQQVLHDFGVRGEIIDANPGPVVTLYELEPAPGIKSSRVIGLSADIARSMSAISARVAVVEGRNVIGIELPNQRRETVWLREMLSSHEFEAARAKLGIGLGKTIGGEPVIVDLARMPHLLVAGTTGSGKSVAINTMILSLLYRHRPDQCRLIMIDPKMLELSVYEGIPHLLTPVVTDPKKAIVALKWAVREMEERYRKMSRLGVRNIDGFNARVAEASAKGEIITRTVQKGFDRETGQVMEEEEIMDLSPLPYIVIVVDEMADLMMVAGKEIEGAIQRLAQMARAAGIHLIMATQRPSVDVITGTIKANFPTRISFQVTSKIDSRTILGEMGAEQLLGQGDMLYMAGGGRISRVHGPFVSDQEVERVVEHLKAQARPEYLDEVTAEEDEESLAPDEAVFDRTDMGTGDDSGDLYDQAVALVLRDKKASTSYIQRRLQIGYNRAASLMERMENEGIVGPANHAGKRDILKDMR